MSVLWIPGSSLSSANEQPSRRRLIRVEKKLSQDPELREEYEKIVRDQLEEEIAEVAPETPTGHRTFYMPHKLVREEDRDAFQFLFNINGKEQHLKFTRVPLEESLAHFC